MNVPDTIVAKCASSLLSSSTHQADKCDWWRQEARQAATRDVGDEDNWRRLLATLAATVSRAFSSSRRGCMWVAVSSSLSSPSPWCRLPGQVGRCFLACRRVTQIVCLFVCLSILCHYLSRNTKRQWSKQLHKYNSTLVTMPTCPFIQGLKEVRV